MPSQFFRHVSCKQKLQAEMVSVRTHRSIEISDREGRPSHLTARQIHHGILVTGASSLSLFTEPLHGTVLASLVIEASPPI